MKPDEIQELANTLTTGTAERHIGAVPTHQQALRFGLRSRGFHVGVRYRDEKTRFMAHKLVKLKLFKHKRAERYGDGSYYYTTELGKAVLRQMHKQEKSDED